MTTDPQETLRATFEQLLAAMCERPSDMNVKLVPSKRKPTLVITCNSVDYGAILGKFATMLLAIKTLAAQMAKRHGLNITVLLDEEGCTSSEGTTARRRYEPNPDWDSAQIEKLTTLFCADLLGDCRVAVEPVVSGTSKVTIATTEDVEEMEAIENAIEMVLNCIGIIQGQRLVVEII